MSSNNDDFMSFFYDLLTLDNFVNLLIVAIFVLASVHLLMALKGFYAGRYVESTSKLFIFLFLMLIVALMVYAFINSESLLSNIIVPEN